MPTDADFRDVPAQSVQERLCPKCGHWWLEWKTSSIMTCQRCRGAEIPNLQNGELRKVLDLATRGIEGDRDCYMCGAAVGVTHYDDSPCKIISNVEKPKSDSLESFIEGIPDTDQIEKRLRTKEDAQKRKDASGWCPGCGGLVHAGECETR